MSNHETLVEIAQGYFRSSVVRAAARLGIADAIAAGKHEVGEMAAACGADAESLYRLLRALAAMGVTAETKAGSFNLTPFGEPLRKDAPHSMWHQVVFWSDLLADNWSYLTECVQTGKTAAQLMAAEGVRSRWSKDPHADAVFRAVMGTAPVEDYMPIVRSWDFSAAQVIADLGGGGGALLSAILATHPHVKGMLVDLPETIESAVPRFQREGLSDRCEMVALDLTERVPGGPDVYVMKSVLHGCKDDKAVVILRNCRAVMTAGGFLLIIEYLLPDVIASADKAMEARLMSDLNMMTVTGGRERSAAEWEKLLSVSGLKLQRVLPVAGGVYIIEATT